MTEVKRWFQDTPHSLTQNYQNTRKNEIGSTYDSIFSSNIQVDNEAASDPSSELTLVMSIVHIEQEILQDSSKESLSCLQDLCNR